MTGVCFWKAIIWNCYLLPIDCVCGGRNIYTEGSQNVLLYFEVILPNSVKCIEQKYKFHFIMPYLNYIDYRGPNNTEIVLFGPNIIQIGYHKIKF